jgi:hypothetical protein
MKKWSWVFVALVVLSLSAVSWFAFSRRNSAGRAMDEMLAAMPADASAVLYVDLASLRQSDFAQHLLAWAPQPQADADYARFLAETGFNYERDLNRIAFATLQNGVPAAWFAVADGRFDQKKIAAFALKTGTLQKISGQVIYSVPVNDPRLPTSATQRISFVFLRRDRIALTTESDLASYLDKKTSEPEAAEWQARFTRLAGSPLFAVVRQNDGARAFPVPAPGGLQSPQLSSLIAQLPWLTIAAKPDGAALRVVAEGESLSDATARQLADLLNGVVILAEAGLNDPKLKQQLDPATRQAYFALLKNVDVTRVDRGETKAVRVVLELTPQFLDAARAALPAATPPAPANSEAAKPPKTARKTKSK